MASLVTQDQACRQLRLDATALTADQLADVNDKAEQASAIVVDYLKRPFIEGPLAPNQDPPAPQPPPAPPPTPPEQDWGLPPSSPWPAVPLDPWTPANVPTLVKAAILMVLTALYDGRTPEDVLLSPSITAILARMRDPAVA